MSSIFLSYSRSDDETFVERLHEDLSARNHTVWWYRAAMKSRGLTFLQELRDAIEQADRVIAIFGPSAVASKYVRVEWGHALLFAKNVIPLLRKGTYEIILAELAKLHTPDFREDAQHTTPIVGFNTEFTF